MEERRGGSESDTGRRRREKDFPAKPTAPAEPEKYPECRKMSSVRERSQPIGEFLEWLSEQGICLAKYSERWEDTLEVHHESTETLLARFFEIDLNKVEEERRAMIEELQAGNAIKLLGENLNAVIE